MDLLISGDIIPLKSPVKSMRSEFIPRRNEPKKLKI